MVSREELLEDFNNVKELWLKEGNTGRLRRDFYREKGKYTEREFEKVFKTFKSFRDEAEITFKREDVIKDMIRLSNNFREDNPDSNAYITREYYRENGKYKEFFERLDTFANLREEAMKKDNINKKQFELEKEVIKLRDKVIEVEKEKAEILRQAMLEEKIKDLFIKNLETKPERWSVLLNNNVEEMSHNNKAILHLSDWHLGETVNKSEVGNINEFNSDILVKRADKVINDFVKYSKYFDIKEANVIINGDMFSGEIHEELTRTNEMNVVECIFFLQEYMANKLCFLSESFNKIDVDIIVGNHARIMRGKPYYKEKVSMSWEYIWGKMLQQQFKLMQNGNAVQKISINVPKSPFIVKEVNSNRFLVTHGDVLTGKGNGGFAGIPAYGLAMSSAKFYGIFHQLGINQEEVHFDNILMGHLHTTGMLPIFNGGHIYLNGSLIGTNEYALNAIKSISKIEQTMLVIDEKGYLHNTIVLRGE